MKKNYLILIFCFIYSISISQTSELDIKVFLEGPFSSYQMIPYLNVFDELPSDQPFNTHPWNYDGVESVSVFPTFDIVDWILVDVIKFQGGDDIKAVELVERKAGLLMKDGKIRDLDATGNLKMDLDGLTQVYIRIQHRNHLSVISSELVKEVGGVFYYDFFTGPNQSLGGQYTQKQLSSTIWGMIAADGNANGQIDNQDKNEEWLVQYGLSGYYGGDFNMDSQVDDADKISQWVSNLGHASIATRDTVVPPFRCGDSLLDARDGRKYATIQVGLQCWMKENLNIGSFIDGTTDQTDNNIFEKHCYNNEPDSCAVNGGLYMWDEMMEYISDTATKGICPPEPGWHLPTDFEWKVLEGNADSQFPIGNQEWNNQGYRGFDAGGHLKDASTRFWQEPNAGATNSTDFTAISGGIKYDNQNLYEYIGQSGIYWSSNLYDINNPYYREFNFSIEKINRLFANKSRSYSVRCINTTKGINYPPYQPHSPTPEDASLDIDTDTTLMWACSDPEGDDITYNIYFGMDIDPPLFVTNHPDTLFNPGTLMVDSTYYWKIVAYDIFGDSTKGPVWSFTVRSFLCGDILIDERDDQYYNTVQIGEQCWMAENLNIGIRIDGINQQTDDEIIEKYCYNDLEDSCDVYGGLYQWNEMMQYTTLEGATGICPDDWYLPSDEEWKQLEGEVDSQFDYPDPFWDIEGWRGFDIGLNLKSQSGWFADVNGLDVVGFTAKPAGFYDFNTLMFLSVSEITSYWSSSENVGGFAAHRYFAFTESTSLRVFNVKDYGFSVRCLRDPYADNVAPSQPYNPSPEDGSMDIDTDTTLMWACSDPEDQDITYNIYFGLDINPPLVDTDFPDTLFNPGTLMMDSTYYWKIVAYDIAGDSTEGPVWSFTVRSFLCGDILIDERDDQYYNTVQIGEQCWMAENLNIGTRIDGINQPTDDEIIEKYCYNDLEDSCDVYGGLYQWNEMMQYTTNEGATGICPEDWYLPSDEEWKQLEGEVDSQFDYPDPFWDIEGWRGYDVGLNLKSQDGWFADVNGLDVVGFTAKPAGLYDFSTLSFQSGIQVTAYWSSSSNINDFAALRYLAFNEATSLRVFNLKNYGFSVRCLRDPYADNVAPSQPYNPNPGDGSMDIDTDTTLMWACSDPEDQDITYNIYFGLETNPPLVATDHPDTLFNPGTMMMDSIYYWKIVAYDITGDSTEGPVWSFTVRSFLCGDVLIDERDDQYYNTVQIGQQCWMAENLNIGTRIDGINQPTDDEIIEKYCYNDLEDSCDVYGGLYQWNEMMQYTTNEGATGICPEDWYLPSDEEWKQLEGEVDSQFDYPDPFWDIEGWRGYDVGLNLKSQDGWFADVNGLDVVGFTAKPAGLYDFSTLSFQSGSQVTGYWSSSDNVSDLAAQRYMSFDNATVLRVFNVKNYGFSVRCIKNETTVKKQ